MTPDSTPQGAYGASRALPDGRPVHTESPAFGNPVYRCWETLDDEQRALARWLTNRAHELWAAADGELSLAEAVTLAAVQARHRIPNGGNPQ